MVNSFNFDSKIEEVSDKKTNIIIYDSDLIDGKSFKGWETRLNGGYKKIPHYTINKEGVVYRHLSDNKITPLFNNTFINGKSIFICLDNKGWLEKKNEKYLNYLSRESKMVFSREWRGKKHWDMYTEKQYETLNNLIQEIIKNNEIGDFITKDNIILDTIYLREGIFTISNYLTTTTNVNPSFDFEKINF